MPTINKILRSLARWPQRRIAAIAEVDGKTRITLTCGHRVPSHRVPEALAEIQGRAIHELAVRCRRCREAT